MNVAIEREAQRQQRLLQALWQPGGDGLVEGLARWPRADAALGLAAYRGNAAAIAARALAAAYPTVAALVGQTATRALAHDLWQQHPASFGDLGEWGAMLPALIAGQPALAAEPYLADCARLDWLVHQAARAADASAIAPALDALATQPPEAVRLVLRPGCALAASAWPIVAIWNAHHAATGHDADRFAAAREALAAGRGETGFVWREGFAVRVDAVDAESAAFVAALLRGHTLVAALDAAGLAFAFDRWLLQALRQGWLVGVESIPPPLP